VRGPRLAVTLIASAASGCANCGRETAHATFTGPETHDVAVTLAAAASVHFDTTIDVNVPGSESTISDEWTYAIQVLHGGAVSRTVTCDAFNVGPGLSSGDLASGEYKLAVHYDPGRFAFREGHWRPGSIDQGLHPLLVRQS
jgi:hypothetical protein